MRVHQCGAQIRRIKRLCCNAAGGRWSSVAFEWDRSAEPEFGYPACFRPLGHDSERRAAALFGQGRLERLFQLKPLGSDVSALRLRDADHRER